MGMEQTSEDRGMDARSIADRFAELQRKLEPMWRFIGWGHLGGSVQEENTIVVITSLTVDFDLPPAELQAYEERFLFLLFLLRQPTVRMIYITSQPIDPNIVDYYLHILPGVVISSARKRLRLVAPRDGSSRPLSRKLLDRPRLIRQIRDLIPDMERAHIVPYNTTDLERELAVQLGLPMYAADPRYFAFGTKSGGRQIFADEGVSHPLGREHISSLNELIDAILEMQAQKPTLSGVVVKLNEGVSGAGNAFVDLGNLPESDDPAARTTIAQRLRAMRFEAGSTKYEDYMAKLASNGAIVEELIRGEQFHSPSVQMRITPLGEVEILSTHDQILGGPGGQSYLGARFPANPNYATLITREAAKIGDRFVREGIVGRFAVDFVVARRAEGEWDAYAIEINLRKGGTTHPYLTLQYLTDGHYDAETGLFATALGHHKYYVASDHIESPAYCVFTPDDLFDIVSRYRFHFDHTSQTGIVMHLMSAVSELGILGATAIADSPEEAQALYDRFVSTLDAEAAMGLRRE